MLQPCQCHGPLDADIIHSRPSIHTDAHTPSVCLYAWPLAVVHLCPFCALEGCFQLDQKLWISSGPSRPVNFSPVQWPTTTSSLQRPKPQPWEGDTLLSMTFPRQSALRSHSSKLFISHRHFYHCLIILYIELPFFISLYGLCFLILFRLIEN